MSPPQGAAITENKTSIYWFDEDGILCSVYKKAPPISLEESKQLIDEFRQVTQGRKFCMLLDITHSAASTKESREFAAVEFPKIVTAMAMLSASPLGRMLANLFFALKPTPYPAKIFATEKEAKDWLKHYL
ncbi:MAG: hypothetical protein M0D57_01335 [Sphingobacteriales bacterium JAD_PAG50586_3]|nr:MAG: hypothetical protein M0D57_01335 [Sphingobacteriales bacterium JAD_PAG50586_3]